MNPYLIIIETGNGYYCGCCRRTDQRHEVQIFESDEEAKAYANRLSCGSDDQRVLEIYRLQTETPVYTK